MVDMTSFAPVPIPSLMIRLGALGRWLTKPLVPIESYETRLKSQWLAAVLITLVPLGMVLSSLGDLKLLLSQPVWQLPSLLVQGIIALCFVPLYFLSRFGHYKLVTALCVGAGIAACLTAIFLESNVSSMAFDYVMLLMPLLFASSMFGRKGIVIVFLVDILCLLFSPLFISVFSYQDIVSGPFNIILMGALLSLLGTWIRELVERHHNDVLAATNTALQLEITERRRAETLLQESNQRYQAVMMQSAACIFLVDLRNFQILEANPALLNLLGYTDSEIRSMTLYEFVAHEPASIHAHTRSIVAEGSRYIGERLYRTKKGAIIDMDVRVNLIHYSGKDVMCVVSHDISSRKRMDEQLRASLQQKEVLLKEIHHRVKNNLQIIASLLNLQSNTIDNPLTVAQFQDSQHRIRSMALIHERLYRSADIAHVDFREYLRDLTGHLLQSYRAKTARVALKVEVGDIQMDIDTAIPCGLLVNELVSNALKHAFPDGHSGTIGVEMRCVVGGNYQLTVWDDGVGLPAGMNYRQTTSLGLQLVNSLTRQLSGTVNVQSLVGTCFTVCFPKVISHQVVQLKDRQ